MCVCSEIKENKSVTASWMSFARVTCVRCLDVMWLGLGDRPFASEDWLLRMGWLVCKCCTSALSVHMCMCVVVWVKCQCGSVRVRDVSWLVWVSCSVELCELGVREFECFVIWPVSSSRLGTTATGTFLLWREKEMVQWSPISHNLFLRSHRLNFGLDYLLALT